MKTRALVIAVLTILVSVLVAMPTLAQDEAEEEIVCEWSNVHNNFEFNGHEGSVGDHYTYTLDGTGMVYIESLTFEGLVDFYHHVGRHNFVVSRSATEFSIRMLLESGMVVSVDPYTGTFEIECDPNKVEGTPNGLYQVEYIRGTVNVSDYRVVYTEGSELTIFPMFALEIEDGVVVKAIVNAVPRDYLDLRYSHFLVVYSGDEGDFIISEELSVSLFETENDFEVNDSVLQIIQIQD